MSYSVYREYREFLNSDCAEPVRSPEDALKSCLDCANSGCNCCKSCVVQNPKSELTYWTKKRT